MFAIARFNVALADASTFNSEMATALDAFSACAGFIDGEFGQNLDDSGLWAFVTRWENEYKQVQTEMVNRDQKIMD